MKDKAAKKTMGRMNKQEFAYNKHLLKEINDKRKTSNYDGYSRASEHQATGFWAGETILNGRVLSCWGLETGSSSNFGIMKITKISDRQSVQAGRQRRPL